VSGTSYPFRFRNPEVKEEKNMKTKDLSLITIFAALYAMLVVFFQPFSFYALQFRVAGVLRPSIAKKRELAVAYALGTVVANVFSPFAGVYELVFMPVMSLLSGLLGYEVAKKFNDSYYICGVVIGIIIPLSVAWMLNQLFNIDFIVSLPGLIVSEQTINLIGSTIFKLIEQRYIWWE
jgi:uncharacterized membrane protein